MVLLGIDHLVIAVPDLDAAAQELEGAVGLAATGGGRHPTLGTQNRLVWLGDQYLELVSIVNRRVALESWLGFPTIAALERGGGLVTWAIASDSVRAEIAVLRALGARLGDPIPGERVRPDGQVVRWQLSLPDRIGPAEPPFLIEHDLRSAEWTKPERAARRVERHPIGGPVRLEVLELPVADVPDAIHKLARAAGLRFRPSLAGGGARDANVGPQIVRLRPTRGRALAPGIGLVSPAGDDRAVEVLGCRWIVRSSR